MTSWLASEIKRRGWSIRELARRAGVSHTTAADVLSKQRDPTADFCLGIARALNMPPEEVLRRAGILPPLPAPEDETFRQILEYVKRMDVEDRQAVLEYVIFRYRRSAESNPGTGLSTAPAQ